VAGCCKHNSGCVRFQVLTAANMMFRIVFCDVLIPDQGSSLMMEAVRTSETSVDNNFTRQYIPEDNSEHHNSRPSGYIRGGKFFDCLGGC
jgi:hypothetical protein